MTYRSGQSVTIAGSPGIGTLPKPAMMAVTSAIAASASVASVPLATIETPLLVGR